MQRLRRFAPAAAAVMVASVLSATGAVWASHQFSDVGTGTFYHDPVDAIVGAGCARGFPDSTFKTSDPATRGQFSLWLSNCGSQIVEASNTDPQPISDSVAEAGNGVPTEVLAVDVDVQGLDPAGSQFVRVDAVLTVECRANPINQSAFSDPETRLVGGSSVGPNECLVQFAVSDEVEAEPALIHSHLLRDVDAAADPRESAPSSTDGASVQPAGVIVQGTTATVSASKVFELNPGETTLRLFVSGTSPNADITALARSITAHVAPFGSITDYQVVEPPL